MLVVADIDVTLAKIDERIKQAGLRPPRFWKRGFQAWLDRLQDPHDMYEDKPQPLVLKTIQVLARSKSVDLVYLTGRSNYYRSVTRRWLRKVGAPKAPLFMRPTGDWRKAVQFKESVMLKLQKKYGSEIVVFDDDGDNDCHPMYKKHGWRHFKVEG